MKIMPEYIDRNALIEHMKKDPLFDLVEQYGVTDVIESFPAADVQPVMHGKWVQIKLLQDGYKAKECSACKATFWDLYRWNYCPNCGAKMDGEE